MWCDAGITSSAATLMIAPANAVPAQTPAPDRVKRAYLREILRTRRETSLMLARALVIWFVILVFASINGALREGAIVPAVGDVAGRAIRTVMLSGLILLLTWLTIEWIHPRSAADAWRVGAVWVAMTLTFEFLAGHYLFGNPWGRLLEDYNLLRGRIWVLALITTAVAPRLCANWRHLMPRS
jgi:hypothetical protein